MRTIRGSGASHGPSQEASDPEVAVILLDIVLGPGCHPDPAIEFAPVIAEAIAGTNGTGRHLEVITCVIGTEDDPQRFGDQKAKLEAAGAKVENTNVAAVRHAGRLVEALERPVEQQFHSRLKPVELVTFQRPLVAINVGLESFFQSLENQGATALHVDWRPPAGDNAKLAGILERMKK